MWPLRLRSAHGDLVRPPAWPMRPPSEGVSLVADPSPSRTPARARRPCAASRVVRRNLAADLRIAPPNSPVRESRGWRSHAVKAASRRFRRSLAPGRNGGRPGKLDARTVAFARRMVEDSNQTVADVAEILGAARSTLLVWSSDVDDGPDRDLVWGIPALVVRVWLGCPTMLARIPHARRRGGLGTSGRVSTVARRWVSSLMVRCSSRCPCRPWASGVVPFAPAGGAGV